MWRYICIFSDNGGPLFCVTEIVHKLIDKGKQLLAVKFIFQFELTDKFPPLPLLEAYISDCKEVAQKIYKNGKSSNRAVVILYIYIYIKII